jgi:hypothetical protein
MRTWAYVIAAGLWAMGCDDAKPKAMDAPAQPATPASSVPSPPATPPPPHAPDILVDDTGCTINGEAFTGAPAEWRDRVVAFLSGKPLVAGQPVEVSVMRDAKMPKIEAALVALKRAKAKSVIVHTPTREQTMGTLELTLTHGALTDCTAVAMIEHDVAVGLWGIGGGTAQRFPHGLAGPDLTLGTEALKKRAAGCDSSSWVLGADDSITWGLAFDLAMRAKAATDGAAPIRATSVILATTAPTPGRRFTEE